MPNEQHIQCGCSPGLQSCWPCGALAGAAAHELQVLGVSCQEKRTMGSRHLHDWIEPPGAGRQLFEDLCTGLPFTLGRHDCMELRTHLFHTVCKRQCPCLGPPLPPLLSVLSAPEPFGRKRPTPLSIASHARCSDAPREEPLLESEGVSEREVGCLYVQSSHHFKAPCRFLRDFWQPTKSLAMPCLCILCPYGVFHGYLHWT